MASAGAWVPWACDDGVMPEHTSLPRPAFTRTACAACLMAVVLSSTPSYSRAQAGANCAPQGTQAQVNACAVQAFQQADTQQHILYGDVMKALAAHERAALRKEQNLWLRQRHQRCKQAQAAFESRADWPRRLHECLTAQIQERHHVLQHWLHHGAPQ